MRVVLATVIAAFLASAQPAYAQRAVQVAPGGKLMVNKLFAGQQWSIVVDFDTQTMAGNVFNTDGTNPQFVWCQIVEPAINDPSDFVGLDTVTLDCLGADGCAQLPCTALDWSELGTIEVVGSFFVPPSFATITPNPTSTLNRTPTAQRTATPLRTATPQPQPTFTPSGGGGDACCRHCTTGIPAATRASQRARRVTRLGAVRASDGRTGYVRTMTERMASPETQAREYLQAWFKWRNRWNGLYYFGGIGAAATSALAAAFAHNGGTSTAPAWLAVLSAILSFIVATTASGKRGRAFERAGRKIERALVVFYNGPNAGDPAVPRDAIIAGLDELDASGA